tara:strand:+ start:805 stop:1260 length:456 start_codon:yes stop_codon:yes gene_type:complete
MESEVNILSKIKIPEFCMSHWLLRIPLAIIFIQQGLMKIPVDIEEAASYGLSYLVWWFVAYGELLGGLGLVVGGFLNKTPATMEQIFGVNLIEPWGDAITRFSGITLCCIMTGVIWIGDPESFVDVLLYDNLHVLLWVGALFFALRGNNAK